MGDQWNALRIGPRILRPGAAEGPLTGRVFAVKDLIDVAGQTAGGGNPALLAERKPAESDAPVVAALLAAGASCVGVTQTDELAFSLAGINRHYPVPVNARHPGRVTGGSSSGSAAAVAAGLVPFALGTDTGGSIRVPASYCGLVGVRPSHGALPLDGVLALAPSFDTVGWLAADVRTAAEVGRVLLPPASGAPAATGVVVLDETLAEVPPDVAEAITHWAERLAEAWSLPLRRASLGTPLQEWLTTFRTIQAAEAWAERGDWIEAHPGALAPEIEARFRSGAGTDPETLATARRRRAELVAALDALLAGGAVIVLPSAAGAAPLRDPLVAGDPDAMAENERVRTHTMRLTSLAGLAGAPVVGLPLAADADGVSVGVSLLGPPGADRLLLDLAEALPAAWLPEPPDAAREQLLAAFYRYEEALVTNDVPVLVELFAPGPHTIRYGPADAAYGADEITAFRRSRPATDLERELLRYDVRVIAPGAGIASTEFVRTGSGRRGRQTQTWTRHPDGWKVELAHVSLLPE